MSPVLWEEDVGGIDARIREFRAGTSRRVVWHGQPLRPAGLYSSSRIGDELQFNIASWRDRDGHYRTESRYDNGTFKVRVDGEVVSKQPHGWNRRIRVPAEPTTIGVRLKSGSIGDPRLDLPISTSWTFESARTSPSEPLPMLKIDYRTGVDLRQQAPFPTPIRLLVGHEAETITSAIESCTLSATNDGGLTWHPVELTQDRPGVFAGTIGIPGTEPGDAIGLRVEASDADGSAIDQKIFSAFLAE